MLSRQVSWLAGQCCCPAFPKPRKVSVTLLDSGSPLTVAGAAPALAFSAAPASLLASEKRFPKNHDGFTYRQGGVRVNSIANGSAWRRLFTASTASAKIFARAAQVPLTR
jgi:hypothetical protein